MTNVNPMIWSGVQSGLALPIRRRNQTGMPIDTLKVGDGFDFDPDIVKNMQQAASYRKRRFGKVFTVGKFEMPDGKVVGRCVRIL